MHKAFCENNSGSKDLDTREYWFFSGESREVVREERDSNVGHVGNDSNEYVDNLEIHGIDFIIAGFLEV